jgi:hypothetical protein
VLVESRGHVFKSNTWACKYRAVVGEGKGDPPQLEEGEVHGHRGDSGQDLAVSVTYCQYEGLEPVAVGDESGPSGEMEWAGIGVRGNELAPPWIVDWKPRYFHVRLNRLWGARAHPGPCIDLSQGR